MIQPSALGSSSCEKVNEDGKTHAKEAHVLVRKRNCIINAQSLQRDASACIIRKKYK